PRGVRCGAGRAHPPGPPGVHGPAPHAAMITWIEFAEAQPDLAEAGRADIYQWGLGLGFLATVRPDGAPRVHPVCPVIGPDGLLVLIAGGPKQQDLLRD